MKAITIKTSLITLLRIDGFNNFQISVPRDSLKQRNYTISTIDADLIAIHDGFNQFIKLFGTPSPGFSKLVFPEMLD